MQQDDHGRTDGHHLSHLIIQTFWPSKAQKEAEAAHKLARQTMMEQITQGTKPFKKGEKVWLESKYLKLRYEMKKLAPNEKGPSK